MPDLATLPILDPAPMQDLWQVSPSRAVRLLGFYLEDLPSQLNALVVAMQNGQAAEVGNIAHSLKSSSRQMGALKLGEAASRVEQAARSFQPDPYLPQFVQSLQALTPPTIEAVRNQIALHSPTPAAQNG
jgi:HPt (histidine-containing phosphotransfer) domain-containing protein